VKSEKNNAPVLAAGGIVVRDARVPLIAVVRLSKNKAWVLPKGKLKPGEEALVAAVREVKEETGHDVEVHEYLGEMAEAPGARPKTVQFWRVQANGKPSRKLMHDVKSVKWLPLDRAVETLSMRTNARFCGRWARRSAWTGSTSRQRPQLSNESTLGCGG
jgi:8-oxo-dGTP diphosphatase